jgi:ZIP family zinc transporter
LVVITGISLHNFPEGMAVYLSTINGWHLGVTIAIAIGLHNFPEGLAVAAPIYAATKSRYQAIKWSLISGLCEPAGALAFGLFFRRYIGSYGVSCMLTGVTAVMLYICFKELIPSANKLCSVSTSLFAHALGGIVLHLSSQLLEQFEH